MKLQIDTSEKTIRVEEQVNFGELVKVLNKLLPKGEWKTYKLETNTVINWNQYPIWTYPNYLPFYALSGVITTTENPYTITGATSGYVTTELNLSGATTADTPYTLTTATTGTYNIEA